MADKPNKNKVSALYVHVPFCRQKCQYCDFYSLQADEHTQSAYLNALAIELGFYKQILAHPLDTIFVGGGTPTCVTADILEKLLELLRQFANDNTEFSIEANPSTIIPEIVNILKNSRVNRINLGVQSFNDDELKLLGRTHDSKIVFQAWDMLREAGFDNLGLDLIYAIVNQTNDSWDNSLETALKLSPKHLSCYALTLEHGTPLDEKVNIGLFSQPEDSTQHQMYYHAIERIEQAGLKQYEISNFSAPQSQCKHNITYWKNGQFVGLGPAAAGQTANIRRTNNRDLKGYVNALLVENRLPDADIEELDTDTQMAETVMMGLRLVEGIERKSFKARFAADITDIFPDVIDKYVNQNALCLTETHLRIPRWAMFCANTILADFIK